MKKPRFWQLQRDHRDMFAEVETAKHPAVVTVQFTVWFFDQFDGDSQFHPTKIKAEEAAVAYLKEHDDWESIEIECCATQPMSNHSICDMINGDHERWMVGRHVYETITKDGEVVDYTSPPPLRSGIRT